MGSWDMRILFVRCNDCNEQEGCDRAVDSRWEVGPAKDMSLFDRISSCTVGCSDCGDGDGRRRYWMMESRPLSLRLLLADDSAHSDCKMTISHGQGHAHTD